MATVATKTLMQTNNGRLTDSRAGTQVDSEVVARFGLVPNFFRLASSDPSVTRNLWGFAQFAYLDNPIPSLFRERLFVYLSRFCDIRYCIARHVGFLVGLGRPAGDPACIPETVENVVRLLKLPLARGEVFEALLAHCQDIDRPLASFPAPGSAGEQVLFACATHLFLQSADASRALDALQSILRPSDLEHLKVFLAFVRTAHYWTKLHPELGFEEDIARLLEAHEVLAACILNDPEAASEGLSHRVRAELASLRELRRQNAAMAKAYDKLASDYQNAEQGLQDGFRDTGRRLCVRF